MICNNCGKELPDGSSICIFCGAKVNSKIKVMPSQQKTNTISAAGISDILNKYKKYLIIVGIAIIVILALRTIIGKGNTTTSSKAEETTNELKDPYGAITGDWGKSNDDYWMTVTGKKITYYQSFYEKWDTVYQDCNKNKVDIEFDGDSYWFHDTVNDICLVYNPYSPETLNIYQYWDGGWNRASMIKRISN